MGRHKQVDRGTSDSSKVRVAPIFNQPVDTRILAQAILALAETNTGRSNRRTKTRHKPARNGTTSSSDQPQGRSADGQENSDG